MILTKNKALVPFLGEKLSIIRGLDPLGLQITSESTYGVLLPGLTNVTHRIRYYGFHCWLLDQFATHVGKADPKQQQDFVRRAELMVALIIRLLGTKPLHIPGSAYADRMIASNTDGVYRLDEGADSRPGGNPDTYWKARMGAFGQYYAGSMRAMGLVGTSAANDQVFVRTSEQVGGISGQQLAAAFSVGIPEPVQHLFLRNIEAGRFREPDLKALAPYFDLSRLHSGSAEEALYLQLLTGVDLPLQEDLASSPFHRKASLRLALSYLHQDQARTTRDFLADNYLAAGAGAEELTLRGWYFYQLNEYWQVACSSVLAAMLRGQDKDGGYVHLPTFLVEFTEQIGEQLQELVPGLDVNKPLSAFLEGNDLQHQEEEQYAVICRELLDYVEPAVQAAAGLALIGLIYHRNHAHFTKLRQYAKDRDLLREGNFLAYAQQLLAKRDWTMMEFIHDFLHRDIILRHQYVSMRKMGTGQQSSQKFEVEGEWLRRTDTMSARFSDPRLDVLLLMAADLHLIDQNNVLTAQGRALIA